MDTQLAETIGERARAARLQAKLTQADLAERLDIAPEVYGRLERGLMLPSVRTLRKLAGVLGVRADHLLGLDNGKPPLSVPHPADDLPPEARRLVRRAAGLSPRQLRLLIVTAAALARS